jgi:hypothetical protein
VEAAADNHSNALLVADSRHCTKSNAHQNPEDVDNELLPELN